MNDEPGKNRPNVKPCLNKVHLLLLFIRRMSFLTELIAQTCSLGTCTFIFSLFCQAYISVEKYIYFILRVCVRFFFFCFVEFSALFVGFANEIK